MGFPDAEDETFENITFRCPTHNRENKAALNSKIKKTSSLSPAQMFFFDFCKIFKNNYFVEKLGTIACYSPISLLLLD